MTFAELNWNCEIQGDYSLCFYDEKTEQKIYFAESDVDIDSLEIKYIYPEMVRQFPWSKECHPEVCFECEMPKNYMEKRLEEVINRLVDEVEALTDNNITDYLYDVIENNIEDGLSYEDIVETLECHATRYVDFINENKE